MMRMIGRLSDTVTRVDELILTGYCDIDLFTTKILNGPVHLREFFKHFCNVKVIRVKQGLELQVTKSLQQDNQGSAPDLLPMLEEIHFHFTWSSHQTDAAKAEYTLKAFEPVITARQRTGPVRLTWSTKPMN